MGDPPLPSEFSGLTKFADDIDIGMTLDRLDYDNFLEELKVVIQDLEYKRLISVDLSKRIDNTLKLSTDMITYREVFEFLPSGNSNFLDSFLLLHIRNRHPLDRYKTLEYLMPSYIKIETQVLLPMKYCTDLV